MSWHRLLWFALLSILMFAVAAACNGDREPPSTLDALGFQAAYDELGTMRDRASDGDVEGAEKAFLRIHKFIHLVDGALLDLPEEVLARAELIDTLVSIHEEIAGERQQEVLVALADDEQQALVEAARALGIEPPQRE